MDLKQTSATISPKFNTHALCIQREDEAYWNGQLKTCLSLSIPSNSNPFSQHAPEYPPISNFSFFHSSIHLLNP